MSCGPGEYDHIFWTHTLCTRATSWYIGYSGPGLIPACAICCIYSSFPCLSLGVYKKEIGFLKIVFFWNPLLVTFLWFTCMIITNKILYLFNILMSIWFHWTPILADMRHPCLLASSHTTIFSVKYDISLLSEKSTSRFVIIVTWTVFIKRKKSFVLEIRAIVLTMQICAIDQMPFKVLRSFLLTCLYSIYH